MKHREMTFIEKAKRFFRPLGESPVFLVLSCIKFIFWAGYSLYSVFLLKNALHAIEAGNREVFLEQIFEFSIFVVLYFVFNFFGRKWEWPTLYYITEEYISNKYVRKLMMMDNNYVESIGTGKMISIYSNGIKRWTELLSFLIRDFTRTGVIFATTIYILYSMNTLYGSIFFFLTIIVHLLVGWIDGFARKYRAIRTERRHEFARKLVQIIMSKMEILQNNQIDARANELTYIHKEIENADDKVARSLFFIFNVPRGFTSLVRIGVLYFIGYQVFASVFTITDFTLAMTILILFETFLLDSVEFYKNFTKEFSDIQSFWDVADRAPKIVGYEKGATFFSRQENIEIKNISYGYNDTKVFDDFSLTIERGKKTALVGASGGGKTTLMKLIAGYLHPNSGLISVMGNKLHETALKSYYPHIGYLTQDPSVFDATIRENLVSALVYENRGTQNQIETKLIEALKLAQCDFVFEMEKGLDTEIGERGVRLSGGQKQRLAIAKIFLKNPEIILLDEPTSALDSFSEEKITEALEALFRGRTVIVIAHRLQTVKKADDIIVIEGGKVIERGDHENLIARKGIYHKMLELQSGF